MQREQAITYFIYFCLLVIGMVLGRLTMAIQYEVMKPREKRAVEGANNRKGIR